jgi:hypothetical protein
MMTHLGHSDRLILHITAIKNNRIKRVWRKSEKTEIGAES